MYQNDLTNYIAGFFGGVTWLVGLMIWILLVVANWKIFEKAGEAGWKSIIPIYSSYILFKIIYGNGWKFLLVLVPLLNIIVSIAMYIRLAQVYGHGTLFALGLLFFPNVFTLILGFDSSVYQGPVYSFI